MGDDERPAPAGDDELRKALFDVLSPYYGALTNSAIEDITGRVAALLDERGRELERLRAIEQRALEVRNIFRESSEAHDTIRYILGRLS